MSKSIDTKYGEKFADPKWYIYNKLTVWKIITGYLDNFDGSAIQCFCFVYVFVSVVSV